MNFDKCAVIVFDNNDLSTSFPYGSCESKCNCGFHYKFGSSLIKQVINYKYLGIDVDQRLSLIDFKNRLIERQESVWRRYGQWELKVAFYL